MTKMKTLFVEDDFTSRLLLQRCLARIATNGRKAVAAGRLALATDDHHPLACRDIMMPETDGQLVRDLPCLNPLADKPSPRKEG